MYQVLVGVACLVPCQEIRNVDFLCESVYVCVVLCAGVLMYLCAYILVSCARVLPVSQVRLPEHPQRERRQLLKKAMRERLKKKKKLRSVCF